MKNKTLHLYSRIIKDSKVWQITFTYADKHNIKVTARDINSRITLIAPLNIKEILDLLPLEFWPAFAIPLATVAEDSNENERLF